MRPRVHIHLFDLADSANHEAASLVLLDAEERCRAERLIGARKRSRFIAARAALRRTLARHCDCDPATLRLATGPRGKPYLLDYSWHFNLSHSHDRLLLAYSPDLPLGVDIECHDPSCDILALARRYFAAAELAAIDAHQTDAHRRRAAYRCWTAKEAALKRVGVGIDRPLRGFFIDGLEALDTGRYRILGDNELAGWVHPIDAGDGATACLACTAAEPELIVAT